MILALFLNMATARATPTHLNLTTIFAANGASTLECWQLSNTFFISSQLGIAGTAVEQLGNAANASLTVLPPKFDGGLHHAPRVQCVLITNQSKGLADKATVDMLFSSPARL